jgi:hypothetical protein
MFTNQDDTDNYETDPDGWLAIQQFIPKDKKIYSPFYCSGKQKDIFKYMGHDIIHEDRDFFSYIPPEDFDLIIDNPPFSCFKEVCSRLKMIDKPFIIIARSNLLLCRWFQRLFCNSLQVIIPDKRITFTHLNNPKKGYTPPLVVSTIVTKWNLKKI